MKFSVLTKGEGLLVLPPFLGGYLNWTALNLIASCICHPCTSHLLYTRLQSIGDHAFVGCTGLVGSLEFPGSLTSIGDFAFSACSNVTAVALPSNGALQYIGDNSFNYCSSINGQITIPTAVTSVGRFSFYSSSLVDAITVLSTDDMLTLGESAFGDNSTGPCSRTTAAAFTVPNLWQFNDTDTDNDNDIKIPVHSGYCKRILLNSLIGIRWTGSRGLR